VAEKNLQRCRPLPGSGEQAGRAPPHRPCQQQADSDSTHSQPGRNTAISPHLSTSALLTGFRAVTLAGTLLGVLRKNEVFAVKKQSSRSSSQLQYPLLMLLPTVIEATQRREAERAGGSGGRRPSASPAPAPAPAASPLSHPRLAGAYLRQLLLLILQSQPSCLTGSRAG